jgi:WD40 repeat protein
VRFAEQLLLDCKPALRGWEWNYLSRLRYGQMPALDHPSHLFGLAVSRDGRFVAVGGSDGTITVRDGQRLGVIRVRRAHASWARSLAFSPDGQRLVSGGWDRGIRLWTMTDDAPVWQATADHIVQCVAFHPDGHLVASSGASGNIQFWDARTGEEIPGIFNQDDNLFALAFSPDGRLLAGGGSDGRVKIWRTEDGRLLHHLPAQSEQILGLAFSPDGRLLAAASGGFYTREQRGEVGIWETTSGRRLHRLGGPNGSSFCVAFSPDGTRIAAGGSADPSVRLWDVATGFQAIRLTGHREAVWSVSFSPDGNRLYSASGDHTLRLWDATPLTPGPGAERAVLAEFASEVHGIAFHPDGKLLATACPEGDLQLWDAPTGRLVQTIKVKGTCCAAFSRNGRWLAAGSFGFIHVWEAPGWEPRDPIPTGDMVNAVSFHPTNGRLAAAVGKAVGIWDVATGVPQATPAGQTNFLLSAVYSPDGQTIASAGFEGEIKVWSADPRPAMHGAVPSPAHPLVCLARAWLPSLGNPSRSLAGHVGRVSCIAFSPDGRHLVSAGVDGVFHHWDTATWSRTTPALGHQGHVRALTFSPDGTQLASAGSDATVRVWDAKDFRPIFALRGHTDSIVGVAFSPAGDLVASVSLDRTVRVWNAKPRPDSAAVTAVDPGN